jgi:hypothetical protein
LGPHRAGKAGESPSAKGESLAEKAIIFHSMVSVSISFLNAMTRNMADP